MDKVPSFNPNLDADSIGGFHSGVWVNPTTGDVGKILQNDGDPVSIHLHQHQHGLTISKYVNGRPVEGYNFNTGQQERG
jgi:hypothetical protein